MNESLARQERDLHGLESVMLEKAVRALKELKWKCLGALAERFRQQTHNLPYTGSIPVRPIAWQLHLVPHDSEDPAGSEGRLFPCAPSSIKTFDLSAPTGQKIEGVSLTDI